MFAIASQGVLGNWLNGKWQLSPSPYLSLLLAPQLHLSTLQLLSRPWLTHCPAVPLCATIASKRIRIRGRDRVGVTDIAHKYAHIHDNKCIHMLCMSVPGQACLSVSVCVCVWDGLEWVLANWEACRSQLWPSAFNRCRLNCQKLIALSNWFMTPLNFGQGKNLNVYLICANQRFSFSCLGYPVVGEGSGV